MAEFVWSKQAQRYGLQVCDIAKTRQFFDKLANDGRLDAETVLEEVEANPKNPLHKASGWHWNDEAALVRKARMQMASMAITGLKEIIVFIEDGELTSEPISVYAQRGKTTVRGGGEVYGVRADMMRSRADRAQLLSRLLWEIHTLERQYSALLSLEPAVAASWAGLRTAIERSIEPQAPEAS